MINRKYINKKYFSKKYFSKKYISMICLLSCMAAAAGCSLKNKSREISDDDKQRYESIEIEDCVRESYPELDVTFESIDIDKIVPALVGDEIDQSKVVVSEDDGITSYTYEAGTKSYSWSTEGGNDLFFCADGPADAGEISVDEADKVVRQIIDACGKECGVGSYDEVKAAGDTIWMLYSFMYDGTPMLGNRNIAFDKYDMDSPSMETAYIECSFEKGSLCRFSIENLPSIKESGKTCEKKDFIGTDRLLSIVETIRGKASSERVSKIGMRYLPLSGDDILHYVPVYEVYFDESKEGKEDAEYAFNTSMLVNAYSGECYD